MTKSRSLISFLGMVCLALIATPLFAGTGSTDIIGGAQTVILEIYTGARSTIYIGAALGIIVMATLAFFGRFGWTKFFAICGGVFLVAMTDQLLMFLNAGEGATGGLAAAGLL